MVLLRFSSNDTPRIFLTKVSPPVIQNSSSRHRAQVRLHGAFGRQEALGDERMLLVEPLTWHRHRNRERAAERIVQGDTDRANTERMLLAVIGNAGLARDPNVGHERIER